MAAAAAATTAAASAAAHAAAGGAALRFVTYNVRRFTDDDGESTVAQVARSLRALQPSFVCLNEVDLDKRPGALEAVAEALGGFHVEFFGHVKGKEGFDKYGNALLSRLPPTGSERTHLDGGFMGEHNGQPYRIHRGMLAVDFALPGSGPALRVAVTHLDHISEAERRVQLEHVVSRLPPSVTTVVMGDLNALTRSDYTDGEWGALERRNAEAGWDPPAAGCLSLLSAAGFADAFEAAHGQDGQGLAALAEPGGAHRWTAHVDHPIYRIDYLWHRAAEGLGPQQVRVSDAFVGLEAVDSDHYPLVVDLVVSEAGEGDCAAL